VEESSKADESVGLFINGSKRNPTTMFSHAGMTLNEMCALDGRKPQTASAAA
jgi:hypothetical protein